MPADLCGGRRRAVSACRDKGFQRDKRVGGGCVDVEQTDMVMSHLPDVVDVGRCSRGWRLAGRNITGCRVARASSWPAENRQMGLGHSLQRGAPKHWVMNNAVQIWGIGIAVWGRERNTTWYR